MHQSINLHDFRSAFHNMGRGNQFSYEGLEVLFNGLEQYEEDTGEQMELDVIALCVDFRELDLGDLLAEYDQEFESLDEANDWLNDQTWVLGYTKNTIICQAF